ncbi:MAG: hypothetical protein Kow0099_33960 [Candidatus Abyssubacteria bacterium]
MQEHSRRQRERQVRAGCLFAIICIIVLLGPTDARAHRVNLFAYVEGDNVIVESYFNDGTPCRDSTIEVFDENANTLLQGNTDAEGKFSFRAPVKSNLLIRLTASMGHRAEFTIPAEDLPGDMPAPESSESSRKEQETMPDKAPGPVEIAPPDIAPNELERALDRALSRNLEPIRRAIEESRRERRFSDVLGGIGYIFGVTGIVFYLLSRRERRK